MLRFHCPFCSVFEDESEEAKAVRRLRKGYYGWYGLGGSVFQWHPEEKYAVRKKFTGKIFMFSIPELASLTYPL